MNLFNLTKGQFEASIKQMVLEAIKESGFTLEKQLNSNSEYSTIKEVTDHFKVTKPTIYNWKKKNLVTSYPHVGRILYKIKEIEETMRKMEFAFGNGRDYSYKDILLSQDQLDRNRYLSLNYYRTFGKIPSKEDLVFYNNYCEKNLLRNDLKNHFPLDDASELVGA